MKKLILFLMASFLVSQIARTQGCIVVRNIAGFGQYNLTDNAFSTSDWQLDMTGRYFKSFRDFKGTKDQNTPEKDQSINHVYSMDISVSRLMRNGWSLNLSVPFTSNSRSSSLEHGGPGTTRHTTRSFGMGDIRFTAYKWLLTPSAKQKGNVQAGLGIKFPTGDYKYQDYFYRNDSTKVLSAVNPSIQLGDGGTGMITELNAFYYLDAANTLSLYGNVYYLFNPREQNGVAFTAGRTPSPQQIRYGSVENSVPDVYSFRAGASYNLKRMAFSAGIRDEGSPVHDVLGGNKGNRRAGHNISVEPGILFKAKKATLYAYVPVIVARNLKQNIPDKLATETTGVYTVSQGGFGNYLIFIGVQFKL
jgi:hypothetical protein